MQNFDYSRRLRNPGASPFLQNPPKKTSYLRANRGFVLLVGGILLFTGGVVVGTYLSQTESQFQAENAKNSREISLANVSPSRHASPAVRDSSIDDSGAFYPPGLKYPPKMDQINYLIEIGAYEPDESIQVGKLILKEAPELQGRIFRTSSGKLFAGYYSRKEEAERALEKIRSFEKDDFTHAELKTVRF